ncbi:MAG: type II secretion system F family protein [Gammaproteobacteria bacterium]|nr:type II secretion system F family protein [Gammaproteobacteria bacterium]
MLNYAYRAIDRDGNGVAGTLAAVDEQSLAEKLQTIGYWLVEAKTCKPDEVREVSRVKRADLAELFSNLAVLLDAGLSIVSALRTLEVESEEDGLKRVLTDVRLNVETGTSLGEALARHPKIFDEQIRNTIAAGEYGGNLGESLREIARYLEWLGRLVADVKQASTYPIVVLCVLMAFMMLLFGFVVPKFAAILTELGLELPLVTKIVIGIGGFAQHYGLFTLAGVGLAVAGFKVAVRRVAPLAFALDRLKLRLPVFGKLNQMICLSRLTHQLGLLLKSGVPITDALGLCQHSLGNRVYGELVGAALNVVLQGGVLSTAFREQADIPGMLVRMIAVGEETGRMEHALSHVSHHLDEDIPRRIKKLFGIIEPLVMLTLISLVGTVAMAIFLPLMSMIGGLGR